MTQHQTVAGARIAVRLVVRLLPGLAARRRYQGEFVADLYGLPPAAQLRYAAGVLSQITALRAALGASRSEPGEADMAPDPFRCRVLRWHSWQTYAAPHGGHVWICSRCGKERGPFFSPDERPAYPVYPAP